jgi:cytochrome P450
MRSFTLSDGTKLPKGSILMVAGSFQDQETFSAPDEFDAERFLKLREANPSSNSHQYVSTSASMFGFGKP